MASTETHSPIHQAAELILGAKRIVVFTGAGISTESGIPDFRSPGGIWTKYDPEDFTYQKYLESPVCRRKNWEMLCENSELMTAKPNDAHLAIVELERMGKLDCVITQNIDSLHQAAGSSPSRVIELHGTVKWVRCLSCDSRYTAEEVISRFEAGESDPSCPKCAGILKSATIAFGEPMPIRETMEAETRSRLSDLFIVIGSSLVVYPAADMPYYALAGGSKLVIINLEPTHLDDRAQVVIRGRAGEVMSEIMTLVRRGISASS